MSDGLVHRITARTKNIDDNSDNEDKSRIISNQNEDEKTSKLKRRPYTLMEDMLLLAIKDNNSGAFMDDLLSYAIRACIMIELAMRGRIKLEPPGARRNRLHKRFVKVIDNSVTGELLLDEALKLISQSAESDTLFSWIDLLCGETWNPTLLHYQIRNVRTRVAKSLAEKGACTIDSLRILFFNFTINPNISPQIRNELISFYKDILLNNWRTMNSLENRDFALITIAYSTNLIDMVIREFESKDYELVYNRLSVLNELNLDLEAAKYCKEHEGNQIDCDVREVILACMSAMLT